MAAPKSFWVVPFIFVFAQSCGDSALSDVEVADPSLLKPDISIARSIDSMDVTTILYRCFIWDKNYNSVELKNGSVYFNGIECGIFKTIFGAPYYKIEPSNLLPYQYNANYSCSIKLADGTIYDNSIVSQAYELDSLLVPLEHSKDSSLYIQWYNTDETSAWTIDIHYDYYQTNADSSKTISRNIETIPIADPSDGCFIIPRHYFTIEDDIFQFFLVLSSKRTGTINSAFTRGGSYVSYASIQSKTIKLK